jgi:hypothetical protein
VHKPNNSIATRRAPGRVGELQKAKARVFSRNQDKNVEQTDLMQRDQR